MLRTVISGTYSVLAGTVATSSTNVSTISVAYPTDIKAGDLLIVQGLVNNAASWGTISGWTNIISSSGSYEIISWINATGSETGSITATINGTATSCVIQMFRVRHASGRLPIYKNSFGGYFSTGTVSQAYTKSTPNIYDLVIAMYCNISALTVTTAPTNMTALTSKTSNPANFSYYSVNRPAGNIDGVISGAVNLRAVQINLE